MLSVGREGVTALPSSSWVGASAAKAAGSVGVGGGLGVPLLVELPLVSFNLMPDFFAGGVGSATALPPGPDARGGSGSWTVRMCFARASDLVKALSHSIITISTYLTTDAHFLLHTWQSTIIRFLLRMTPHMRLQRIPTRMIARLTLTFSPLTRVLRPLRTSCRAMRGLYVSH